MIRVTVDLDNNPLDTCFGIAISTHKKTLHAANNRHWVFDAAIMDSHKVTQVFLECKVALNGMIYHKH